MNENPPTESEEPDSVDRDRAAETRAIDLDSVPMRAAVIGGDGTVRLVNRLFAEWIGRPPAEIEGVTVAEIFPTEILERCSSSVEKAHRGETVAQEVSIKKAGGNSLHLKLHLVPDQRTSRAAPFDVVAFFSDISEQRRTESRLATKDAVTEALSRSTSISDGVPRVMQVLCEVLGCRLSALWLEDPESGHLRCENVHAADKALERLFDDECAGLAFEPGRGIIGRVWTSGEQAFVRDVGQMAEFVRKEFAEAANLGPMLAFPMKLGTGVIGVLEFFIEECEPPHEALQPMLTAIVSQLAQFIERHRAEEALRESERRLALLMDLVPQLIWSADQNGTVDFCSRRHEQYNGLVQRDDGSWNWAPIIHPGDAEATFAAWARALRTDEAYEIEHRLQTVDGSFRWHLSRALPLRNRQGKVARWFGSATDIHALKTAQREAEQLVVERQAILETMIQGLAVVGFDGALQYMNPAGRRILGLAGEEEDRLCGPTLSTKAFHPRHMDGEPVDPEDLPEALASKGVSVNARRLRLTLPDGREVALVFNAAPLEDPSGGISGAIVTFEDITARDRAEQDLRRSEANLRATFEGVADSILTLDASGNVVNLNPAFASLHGFADVEHAERSGEFYAKEFWVKSVDGEDVACADLPFSRALRGETVREMELQVFSRATGEMLFIGNYSAVPIRDDRGNILQIVITIQDVTERRQAEQRQELLTREVNHRARNALAVVQAITRLTKAESVEEYGSAVRRRVETLVRSHSRLADNKWQEVSLRALIGDEVLPYAGEEENRVNISGGDVRTAPEAVQPVSMALHELATNSGKYGALATPKGRVAIVIEAAADGSMKIEWSETGGAEVVAPPSRRGVGSTVIESVAAQLAGSVKFVWERQGLRCLLNFGRGAKTVPRSAAASSAREEEISPSHPHPRGGRRIMVVEDDALLAMDAAETLTELGYEVVGPFPTLEAAGEYVARREFLAGAVLDVNVAGQTTYAIADALLAEGVPVLFTTGYAISDEIRGRKAGYIQKPFTKSDLKHALAVFLTP